MYEDALLPGLDHDQARRLVDLLAGSLGERQTLEQLVEKYFSLTLAWFQVR